MTTDSSDSITFFSDCYTTRFCIALSYTRVYCEGKEARISSGLERAAAQHYDTEDYLPLPLDRPACPTAD